MLYVYRRAQRESARELADTLNLKARRIFDLGQAHLGNGVRAGDVVICWGDSVPTQNGIRVLNGGPIRSKFDDAQKLKAAGINPVEVSRVRPQQAQRAPAPPDPLV